MLTRSLLQLTIGALCLAVSGSARAEDFLVRLGLRHGHLAELFFGCDAKATAGYDRGLDDLAPPPGIETGYTAFVPDTPNFPPFYKDVRPPAATVSWKLMAKVWRNKPIEVSWDPTTLPAGFDFAIDGAGARLDMRRSASVTVDATRTLTITATRQSGVVAPPAN